VTTPLASASSNVYTLRFDGNTVYVLAKRRQKLLHSIPLSELASIDFKPASGAGGGKIRFRTTGRPSARETIFFRSGQQHDMQAFADTVQRYIHPLPPAADPWAGRQPEVGSSVARQHDRSTMRIMRWNARLAGLDVFLFFLPIVLVILLAVGMTVAWFALR
jgi:hypothetical protein